MGSIQNLGEAIAPILLNLKNDSDLIPAIAQDSESREVLMLAWMNREALLQTSKTGKATYWSRSRNEIWVKGATSGHYQEVEELKFDCDADAVLLMVKQIGAACHSGERTCFHNSISFGAEN